MIRKEDALEYHSKGKPGKIEISPTKPCTTQRELSLAYTPGVAEPCLEIKSNPEDVYKYTDKGNLVAVVSNGTAVLGLGNIGPEAGKPVMEGKGILFKRFADIDVFDIELKSQNPDEIINAVRLLEPTFGGINLEDIKAPECFYIEEELKKIMNIPVFHDDQHGTAIISGAALINALEIVNKKIDTVKVVFSGAGAAGIACAMLYEKLGVKKENLMLVDTKGVVYKGRKEGMNKYKEYLAADTDKRTLSEALEGADVFCGVSAKGILTGDMIKRMSRDPLIFAMANPDPEITYEEAIEARPDAIVATGRSDYPNQVNNVLGFPFIFRGALDTRATAINDEMKIAASYALASLAKEDVPDSVMRAYGETRIEFGRNYIIPKPFDSRVLYKVAPAVAKAAMDSGIARLPINDFEAYRDSLEARLGRTSQITRFFIHKAKDSPKRIVFPEGEEEKILRATQIIIDEKIARPILLGSPERIEAKIEELNLNIDMAKCEIIKPSSSGEYESYANDFFRLRQRKGMTLIDAHRQAKIPNIFGMLMVRNNDADGLISGLTQHYPDTIKPALQIIGKKPGMHIIAGIYMLIFKNRTLFISDPTVNIEPTAEELAEITLLSADTLAAFDFVPKIAMLSFSNFGSTRHPLTEKVKKAVEIVKDKRPDLMIDGEMFADIAIRNDVLKSIYPFTSLKEPANLLICPDLTSANIAYKLLVAVGDASAIGPILMGINKPVYLLGPESFTDDIVNITAMAVYEAKRTTK
jgi:malate dehydrogenase (oxaloacetate-decarboxylating)(NADP+)